ncbi:hypothetical protein CHLNCDRAFT_48854 [Chlorella variabilis]|uniref:Large ribosomal subunit protein uL5 N-terminal domain-containing protein n=1 Tax=Chlorella variabilis TaxID=554065 RepID=E1ZG05_CHLVA|nr:hypothetical protein CHLNCDRAFT_48854 [Chlorella variabilis]EFN55213.1 hypothetical protein CHLNCDRAFT_48854 [Chlorella variabilis]|eukprot:XP_005847315.1 hypothetical protein CHLNCDRAFT_48854 [Chlorella variabilis]
MVADKKASNPMRDIRVSKLVLNCCTGESGDRLQKAAKISACRRSRRPQLTGQQPVFGKARYTVRQWSIRRNEKISAHVTVRGEKAMQLLVRGCAGAAAGACGRPAAGGSLGAAAAAACCIASALCCCWCRGMDFYVVLERPGYRVARRRKQLAKVGVQHRVTKDDAIKWFQQKFEGVVLNKAHAS